MRRSAERAASQPDRAVGGLGEGAAPPLGAARIVGRDDHIDIATRHAFDHGAAVVLRAQWRIDFEEGSVGTDVVLVQSEVVD